MASGFGIKGGPGRCSPLWMGFSECMATAEEPRACKDLRDDYLECLHHRKEYAQLNAFFREDKKQRDAAEAGGAGGGKGGH
jgi:NADH dehydrogenase (ubiquinone) Fe-S protein 5